MPEAMQDSVFVGVPRLELKYLVDETTAEQVRADIQAYCVPDRHGGPGARAYGVRTLYLDTPSLAFHRAKVRGDPDRLKLRTRTYDDGDRVYLEIKRKTGEVVTKVRVAVDRAGWPQAARGFGRPIDDTPARRRRMDAFAHLLAQTGAEPWLLVHYERQAFVSTVDRYGRVTFDRGIRAAHTRAWDLDPADPRWLSLDTGSSGDPRSKVILELKCEPMMPEWITWLIRSHGLTRSAFSKYSRGVKAVSRELFLDMQHAVGA